MCRTIKIITSSTDWGSQASTDTVCCTQTQANEEYTSRATKLESPLSNSALTAPRSSLCYTNSEGSPTNSSCYPNPSSPPLKANNTASYLRLHLPTPTRTHPPTRILLV